MILDEDSGWVGATTLGACSRFGTFSEVILTTAQCHRLSDADLFPLVEALREASVGVIATLKDG